MSGTWHHDTHPKPEIYLQTSSVQEAAAASWNGLDSGDLFTTLSTPFGTSRTLEDTEAGPSWNPIATMHTSTKFILASPTFEQKLRVLIILDLDSSDPNSYDNTHIYEYWTDEQLRRLKRHHVYIVETSFDFDALFEPTTEESELFHPTAAQPAVSSYDYQMQDVDNETRSPAVQSSDGHPATTSERRPKYRHPSVFACYGGIPNYTPGPGLAVTSTKTYGRCDYCHVVNAWPKCLHGASRPSSPGPFDPLKLRPRCDDCFNVISKNNARRITNCGCLVTYDQLVTYDERFLRLHRTDFSKAIDDMKVDAGSAAARRKLIEMLGLKEHEEELMALC